MDAKVGHWAFIVGVLLAIVTGLIPQLKGMNELVWILVILGLLVGFLNITAKETTSFLVATIALMLVGSAVTSALPEFAVLGIIKAILGNIVAFVAPAALVVALKAIYALAAD